MAGGKASQIWKVDLICFFLFIMLMLSGLISWALPHGRGGGFYVNYGFPRHLLVDIHAWIGVAFAALITLHLALHWTYIKKKLASNAKSKQNS